MLNPFRYKHTPDKPAPEPIFVAPPHPATIDEEALASQCEVTKDRGSGPGGQHRNKVESRISIIHTPTGVEAMAGERRSAVDNRRVAMFRLRLALAVRVRTSMPAGDVRSELWKSRCVQGKIACNPRHRDYPSLLAEALDIVWACGLDVPAAALRLCCSTSQLLKLIKDHPPAFLMLNQAREAAGLHKLH
jgi:Protein chain release factor B